MHLQGKKVYLDIYMKKMPDNNFFNQTYEFKNIVYDMKLKWIILIDIMLMIMCVLIKKNHIRNWGDDQIKLNLPYRNCLIF